MKLIDADKLRDALQNEIDKASPPYNDTVGAIRCGIRLARNILEDAPTIDAEPVRHGRWIFNPKDAIEMMFTLPKCSECGAESPNGGNYCPNCGTKMDKE